MSKSESVWGERRNCSLRQAGRSSRGPSRLLPSSSQLIIHWATFPSPPPLRACTVGQSSGAFVCSLAGGRCAAEGAGRGGEACVLGLRGKLGRAVLNQFIGEELEFLTGCAPCHRPSFLKARGGIPRCKASSVFTMPKSASSPGFPRGTHRWREGERPLQGPK